MSRTGEPCTLHFYLRRPNWFLYSSRAARNNLGSTSPVWGSVPNGRRNRRIWGSGLNTYIKRKGWGCSRPHKISVWILSGFCEHESDKWHTDELHSGAIRDFVVRQFDAILIRTKSDLWATSWQALWEEWRALQLRLLRGLVSADYSM